MAEQTQKEVWQKFVAQLRQEGAEPEILNLAEHQLRRVQRLDAIEAKIKELVGEKLGVSLTFHFQDEFTQALVIMAAELIPGIVLDNFTIIVPTDQVLLFADLAPERIAVMAEEGRKEYKILEVIFGKDLPKALEEVRTRKK